MCKGKDCECNCNSDLPFDDAEYKGKKVTLNKPIRSPSGSSKKFHVFVKNSQGNVVKVSFGDPDMEIKRDDKKARDSFRARHKCEQQKDPTKPAYWSCRMWEADKTVTEITDVHFTDKSIIFDSKNKNAISMRDGVLEYLGSELGLTPEDKIFKVYRSPATVANCVNGLDGIPITDNHVSLDKEPDNPVGSVLNSVLVDHFNDEYNSTVAVKNGVKVDDESILSDKRETSLGYNARLIAHDKYDFEQRDIQPHHLAIVDRGRCGSACRFTDKRGQKMTVKQPEGNKDQDIFNDENGNLNLERVIEIAMKLPEALKKLPTDQLNKVMPALEGIVQNVNGSEPSQDVEDNPKKEGEDGMPENKKPVTDSSEFKEAVEKAVTKQLKDSVNDAISKHTQAIQKAKDFLPEDYDFTGKDTNQIMRDTLDHELGKDTKFEDSELTIAFKTLRKTVSKNHQYKNFGDETRNKGKFSQYIEQKAGK